MPGKAFWAAFLWEKVGLIPGKIFLGDFVFSRFVFPRGKRVHMFIPEMWRNKEGEQEDARGVLPH